MQCYTELTPPTAVTHSLSLPFVSAKSNNLIVAKTSLLQIFSTKTIEVEVEDNAAKDATRRGDAHDTTINIEDGLADSFPGEDSAMRVDRTKQTKLILVAEYTLSGTITSLVRIKTISEIGWRIPASWI